MAAECRYLGLMSLDVGDSVTYGLDLLSVLVGNCDAELLLELHDKLYGFEAVSAEVGSEYCCFGFFPSPIVLNFSPIFLLFNLT